MNDHFRFLRFTGKTSRLTTIIFSVILIASASIPQASQLPDTYQQELVARMLYMRNMGPMPESLKGQPPDRCGTSTALEYFINRDKMAEKYTLGMTADDRPVLPNVVKSPGEYFQIHYDISGADSVYLPALDTLGGGDGIPDYVNKIAEIADSVWEFEVNHLGFPNPPFDLTGGGDSLMDIYILNLGSSYYGITYPETTLTVQSVTSYFVIDNDYDFYPYNGSAELDRRLDAARVTVAHEFFHTIHFGMDYTEYEYESGYIKLYWWEMSAVWMEEMAYDNVNDYYYYLSSYLDCPWLGLQYCLYPEGILHQYGACLFPLYLTEKFDTSIVLDIWTRCKSYGIGSQFPLAADSAILNSSAGAHDMLTAFNEFAAWNMWTSIGIGFAPDGLGYSEAGQYETMPDSCNLKIYQYDDVNLVWPDWPDSLSDGTSLLSYKSHMPHNLGAHYIYLKNPGQLTDTLYFSGDPYIDWAVMLLGYNPNTQKDEIIRQYTTTAKEDIQFYASDYPEYEYFILVVTPVSTDINLYPEEFGYSLVAGQAVDVAEDPGETTLPEKYSLSQNYPNPFNPVTSIAFSLPSRSDVELIIYNTIGGKIVTLADENLPAGNYTIIWDGTDQGGKPQPSGIYFYRLSCDGFEKSKKMILLK